MQEPVSWFSFPLMPSPLPFAVLASCLILPLAAAPVFEKQVLTTEFVAEGAHFADFNHDGKMDICAGPYLWMGPDYKQRVEYTQPAAEPYNPGKSYSDYFLTYTHDFNGDGWADILVYSWPGKEAAWFQNPQNQPGHWQRHVFLDIADNESPTIGDMNGDGKPELICHTSDDSQKKVGGRLGFAEIDWAKPTSKARFRPITPVSEENSQKYFRYTHGYGFGDVNGDGRPDIVIKDAWFEQPADMAGDPLWKEHKVNFVPEGARGGGHMLVMDVNGNGRPDVITSHDGHGFGLSWNEQKEDGSFVRHPILGSTPEENPQGVKFSQIHALATADIDGDGLTDFVTGKRRWAHGPLKDDEPNAPPVLYWFQLQRDGQGGAKFVAHLIDDQSGVGTQVTPGDLTGDGKPDIVVANKLGVFVFTQK